MMETEVINEQSDDSLEDTHPQSSGDNSSLTKRIVDLEEENKELKSRIGDLVRTSGEKQKAVEQQYEQWANSATAWWTERVDELKATIRKYEEILEKDDEGTRVVLEERKEREEADRRRIEAQREAERIARNEVQNAIEQARRAFPEVDVSEYTSATSPEQVWSLASQANKRKMDQAMDERFEQLKSQFVPAQPEYQDDPQEEASRVPGASSGVSSAASRRGNTDEVTARLRQLDKEIEESKRNKQLARTIALRGQRMALERQLQSR